MSGRVPMRAALKHRNRVLHRLVQAIMAVTICHWEITLHHTVDQINTEGTGGMSERIGEGFIPPKEELRVVVVSYRGRLADVDLWQWI